MDMQATSYRSKGSQSVTARVGKDEYVTWQRLIARGCDDAWLCNVEELMGCIRYCVMEVCERPWRVSYSVCKKLDFSSGTVFLESELVDRL
jgi:hypothetical protein